MKTIGIPRSILTAPLTHALQNSGNLQVIRDSRPALAEKLRELELSVALLSPLDYAKESSNYCIVPDIAVVSREGDSSIFVRFREGVSKISTLAVDPAFASEILLAKIILAESFDLEPTIVPMISAPDQMLQKADAALLAGDDAFRSRFQSERIIDIVEEWHVMTGLPFVHALWCGREADLTREEVRQIRDAGIEGAARIADIVMEFPPDEREALQSYLESVSYDLDDEARESLAEFMKYLYYHGIFPDVGEVNFFPTDGATDDLLPRFSPN